MTDSMKPMSKDAAPLETGPKNAKKNAMNEKINSSLKNLYNDVVSEEVPGTFRQLPARGSKESDI